MPLPIFPDFPPLSDSSQDDVQVRVDEAQFGGGYLRSAELGMNPGRHRQLPRRLDPVHFLGRLPAEDQRCRQFPVRRRDPGLEQHRIPVPGRGTWIRVRRCGRWVRRAAVPGSQRCDCGARACLNGALWCRPVGPWADEPTQEDSLSEDPQAYRRGEAPGGSRTRFAASKAG